MLLSLIAIYYSRKRFGEAKIFYANTKIYFIEWFFVFRAKVIPLGIFIMASVWNLPPAADKKISDISKKIETQKSAIEKENAVIALQEDSYICKRAKVVLASLDLKMSNVDYDFERKKEELEVALELAQKAYSDGLQLAKEAKIEREHQLKLKIEAQEQIVKQEGEKKSKVIVRAEAEIERLLEEKRKVLKACGINIPLPSFTPAPEREPEPEVTVADFFRETRLDGTPITTSHLDGPFKYVETSLPGIGSLPKRKTAYGPVSDLQEAARKARAENKS